MKSTIALEWNLFRPEVIASVRSSVMEFCAATNATTALSVQQARDEVRQRLALGLSQGEALPILQQRIREVFQSPYRANMIAMTEASRAMHGGQLLAAQASGIVRGFRWLASADACPRCQELDGTVVRLGEPFFVDPKGGPYAVVYHAPLHPHCMCAVVEVLA